MEGGSNAREECSRNCASSTACTAEALCARGSKDSSKRVATMTWMAEDKGSEESNVESACKVRDS